MRQTHHERVNVEDHEHVNVEELRWFLSLCATENTRTSAEQLGVGQSVLSRGLGRLEGELDAELFSRVGRHLRLNRFGHLYRAHVQRAIAELDAGAENIRLQHRGSEALRLGFLHGAGGWLGAGPLQALATQRPDIIVNLREGTSRQLLSWLSDGLIDVAMTTEPEPRHQFEWIPAAPTTLLLGVPTDHVLATRSRVAITDLGQESFVSYRSGTDIRERVNTALTAAAIVPSVVLETNDTATLLHMIAAGLGVGLLPTTPAASLPDGMLLLPTDPPLVWSLGLALQGRAPRRTYLAEFIDHVRRA
jgi:DNA-binding transcriptional LysR family regulator